jgi:ribosomal protein L11 methylase PrmA
MDVKFDPGSFKDPEGRVFHHEGVVYRTLSEAAARRMQELSGTIEGLVRDGLLIDSQLVSHREAGLPAERFGKILMRHQRIGVVTYPFEWSFDMLRDAALCTLDMLEHCLDRGLILKDATAYNVAFQRGRMRFIDTLSIDSYQDGEPWDGYAQFCREFLFPLMLTAYRGVEFQPWLRGELNGLPLPDFARLLTGRDYLRSGVLRHVILPRRLEKSFSDSDVAIRSNFRDIRFSKELIGANLRGLRKLIGSLSYGAADSVWIDYEKTSSYSDDASRAKADFVNRALSRLTPAGSNPTRIVDLGCNLGSYSLLAAETASSVIALDIDPACVNVLYRRLGQGAKGEVTPMVGNLLNPSPGLGWNLQERRPLFERIGSDAFLALALVHHICIGGNVPLASFLDLLAGIAPGGVLEWVDKSDSMVQRMLRNRADVFADYTWENFEKLLRQRFELAEVLESHEGKRRLCLLLPRDLSPKQSTSSR